MSDTAQGITIFHGTERAFDSIRLPVGDSALPRHGMDQYGIGFYAATRPGDDAVARQYATNYAGQNGLVLEARLPAEFQFLNFEEPLGEARAAALRAGYLEANTGNASLDAYYRAMAEQITPQMSGQQLWDEGVSVNSYQRWAEAQSAVAIDDATLTRTMRADRSQLYRALETHGIALPDMEALTPEQTATVQRELRALASQQPPLNSYYQTVADNLRPDATAQEITARLMNTRAASAAVSRPAEVALDGVAGSMDDMLTHTLNDAGIHGLHIPREDTIVFKGQSTIDQLPDMRIRDVVGTGPTGSSVFTARPIQAGEVMIPSAQTRRREMSGNPNHIQADDVPHTNQIPQARGALAMDRADIETIREAQYRTQRAAMAPAQAPRFSIEFAYRAGEVPVTVPDVRLTDGQLAFFPRTLNAEEAVAYGYGAMVETRQYVNGQQITLPQAGPVASVPLTTTDAARLIDDQRIRNAIADYVLTSSELQAFRTGLPYDMAESDILNRVLLERLPNELAGLSPEHANLWLEQFAARAEMQDDMAVVLTRMQEAASDAGRPFNGPQALAALEAEVADMHFVAARDHFAAQADTVASRSPTSPERLDELRMGAGDAPSASVADNVVRPAQFMNAHDARGTGASLADVAAGGPQQVGRAELFTDGNLALQPQTVADETPALRGHRGRTGDPVVPTAANDLAPVRTVPRAETPLPLPVAANDDGIAAARALAEQAMQGLPEADRIAIRAAAAAQDVGSLARLGRGLAAKLPFAGVAIAGGFVGFTVLSAAHAAERNELTQAQLDAVIAGGVAYTAGQAGSIITGFGAEEAVEASLRLAGVPEQYRFGTTRDAVGDVLGSVFTGIEWQARLSSVPQEAIDRFLNQTLPEDYALSDQPLLRQFVDEKARILREAEEGVTTSHIGNAKLGTITTNTHYADAGEVRRSLEGAARHYLAAGGDLGRVYIEKGWEEKIEQAQQQGLIPQFGDGSLNFTHLYGALAAAGVTGNQYDTNRDGLFTVDEMIGHLQTTQLPEIVVTASRSGNNGNGRG